MVHTDRPCGVSGFEILEKNVSWIVSVSDQNVKRLGELLKGGGIVAFPTETVYGLGASVFSSKALLNVFAFKGRPFSDPLIVHLHSAHQASAVALLEGLVAEVFQVLSKVFWPGPLTLILPARSDLDPLVNARSGTVAVRVPSHPLAQRLLAEADVPVAAPSANRFGHVSPTTARHVWDDLSGHEVAILDGGAASVGVESTVLRVLDSEIALMRPGPISETEIRRVLKPFGDRIRFVTLKRQVKEQADSIEISPGQLLTHYAPEVPCAVLKDGRLSFDDLENRLKTSFEIQASATSMIDFGGSFLNHQNVFCHYLDLSPSSQATEALFNAFSFLRECERKPGCKLILLPNLGTHALSEQIQDAEKLKALEDRFLRASSGKIL